MNSRKNHLLAAASIAMLIAVSGCSSNKSEHAPLLPNPAATVSMGWHSFDPATITIQSGQTVQWHNSTLINHTVTCDPAKAANKDDTAMPPGAAPFDSGDVSDDYQHTFTTPGTYKYFCIPHETKGMIGEVIVKP